jgi:hypothetical protein
MIRSFLLAMLLSVMSFVIPSATAGELSEQFKIGYVVYTKSLAPGTLNASWMFTTKYKGPGIATTGGPKTGFASRYHVRYFLESGEFSDEYDLPIEKINDIYKVSCIVDGTLKATGVGTEVKNSLSEGLRRAD